MDEVRDVADSTHNDGGDTGKHTLTKILETNIDQADKALEKKRKERKERQKTPEPSKHSEGDDEPDDKSGGDTKGGRKAQEHGDDGKKVTPKVEKTGGKTPKESEDQPFAPKTWSEAARQAFESADPAMRDEINKLVKNLQGGFTKKTTEIAEIRRVADEVSSAFQPHHRAWMQQNGTTEGAVLREFLALNDFYQRDPAGYARHIIQQAGLRPEHLGFASSPQGQQQPVQNGNSADPYVAQVQNELAAMKQVLVQAAQQSQQRQHIEYQGKFNDAATAASDFHNAIDESGAPLYPHFDAVWRDMMPHIQAMNSDPAKSKMSHQDKLKAAYDMAVWGNPETRKALQEAEKSKLADDFERQRSRNALSSRPRGGGGVITHQGGKRKTLNESLDAAMRKHGI